MESIIQFIIKFNDKLIYISTGLICLLSAMIVWWQVFGKKGLNTGDKPSLDIDEIEASLKKILSDTNFSIQNVTRPSGDPKEGSDSSGILSSEGQPLNDMVSLKAELQIRAKIIEDLQNRVKSMKSEEGNDDSAALLAKIRGLESKLAEYEIIEDDIADLSFFKEENEKLKKELDAITRVGPKMVDQFAEALVEESAPVKKTDATAEFDTSKFVSASAEASLKAEEALDKAASESSEAISDPKTIEELEKIPRPEEIVSRDSDDNAAKDAVESDNIFGEFTSTEGQTDDPLADLGDIDPDRMLDELKDLNVSLEVGVEAIEEDPDIDKMAAEAVNLGKKE